jgi:hypothetical protein
LQSQRIPKRAGASGQQIKLAASAEPIPGSEQRFPVMKFSLPLAPPISPKATGHRDADKGNEPEMQSGETLSSPIWHLTTRLRS